MGNKKFLYPDSDTAILLQGSKQSGLEVNINDGKCMSKIKSKKSKAIPVTDRKGPKGCETLIQSSILAGVELLPPVPLEEDILGVVRVVCGVL
jgi:hypothetical protein